MSKDNDRKRKGGEFVNEISKKQEVEKNQNGVQNFNKKSVKKKFHNQQKSNVTKLKSYEDKNSGSAFINKNMSQNGDKVNNKIIQMKLRVIDEDAELPEDKVLSYLQMRSYLRSMRRFKGLVYFYHGADEEHTYFNETLNKINHLYYESDVPGLFERMLKYMYIQEIKNNKSMRNVLEDETNPENNMQL